MSVISKSILLVDDDQEIRELLQTYLSRAGFQVRGVSDGAGFRQAMNEAPCDLVILDVMLPDEDGFSLPLDSPAPAPGAGADHHAHRQFRRSRPRDRPGAGRR